MKRMDFGGGRTAPPAGWGGKSPREAAKGTRKKRTETDGSYLLLSPHFCATQFIWINILFTPNSRILKTLKGAHPLMFHIPAHVLKRLQAHRYAPPSPSLQCSIWSVFKGRSAHTFEGEGLHVCEGRVPSSMTDVHYRGWPGCQNVSVQHLKLTAEPQQLLKTLTFNYSHLDRPN